MQFTSAVCARALAAFLSVVFLAALPVSAAPIVISFDATFSEPSFPDVVDNDLLVLAIGSEITLANTTNVGELLFDDESVDVTSTASATTIAYKIQGGDVTAHPLNPSYSLTGWDADANLTFSDFQLNVPGTLTGVTVTVGQAGSSPQVIGESGGALVPGIDYLFNPLTSSITIFLSELGVLNQGVPPVGLITFGLTFQATQDPEIPAIPEPASLTLLGLGLSAIAATRRRVLVKVS